MKRHTSNTKKQQTTTKTIRTNHDRKDSNSQDKIHVQNQSLMNTQILILNDDMDTMKEMKSILSKINMLSKHTLDLYRDVWIAEFPDLT